MSRLDAVAWAGAWTAAAWLCLAAPAGGAARQADEPPVGPQAMDHALRGGLRYLASRLDPATGRCLEESRPDNPLFGGRTALIAYAMLAVGADPHQPPLSASIQWLLEAQLHGTYAVALRVFALAQLENPDHLPSLQRDADWLVKAASDQGGYTYSSLDGAPSNAVDNSNSHFAALAVEAARQRGATVPQEYWQRVWNYWSRQQQGDGGWGYRLLPGSLRTRSYGAMTAAGLAVMLVCQDRLDRFERDDYGALSDSRPVAAAQQWMAERFTAAENPGKGVQYHFYWLCAAGRAGRLCGTKRFGQTDWFTQGAAELLSQRNSDGSFGRGDRLVDSALAVLFLSAGRQPLLAGKLRYGGRWNSRPRDLAELADYLGRTFERPLGWQIVSADGQADDFADAPILYISGDGPIELSDATAARLRQYVLRGGMIVSEACASNGDFTLDLRGIYRRMFPEFPFERVPDDHPVYSLHFKPTEVGGLMGMSNGIRVLALHSPRDLSTALQSGQEGAEAQLLANVYLYATDRAGTDGRPALDWPVRSARPGRLKAIAARLAHEGNCDAEPLAWDRLAIEAHNAAGVDLEVVGPMPIEQLHARRWSVAVMSGTREFHLSPAQTATLARYLRDGGTLIVEAAGGSKDFAAAAHREVFPLLPGVMPRPLDPALALAGAWPVDAIAWRRDFSAALGPARRELRLQGLHLDGRPAVIFSAEDLTAGLLDVAGCQIRGYSPATARAIMTNLLVNLQPQPSSQAASQPTTSPSSRPESRIAQ
jgi:hypothetical protein